jgi:hypothetical protein
VDRANQLVPPKKWLFGAKEAQRRLLAPLLPMANTKPFQAFGRNVDQWETIQVANDW